MTLSTPSSSSRVLAVILNWNKKPFVDRLLGDLGRLDRPPDRILVVDNASTDGSVEMIRDKHPQVDLLCHPENLGGTGGFNSGMRWGLEAGGFDYLWLLDNDVVLHPGALSALLEVADRDERVGLVGSRIVVLGQPDRTQEVGARIDWATGALIRVGTEEEIPEGGLSRPAVPEVDYAASCSLLARVRAVEEVGLWDPGYFLFYDDIEWGVRFNRAGWKVKATTGSVVEHESYFDRRATQALGWRYQWLRNSLFFLHSFSPSRTRVGVLAYVFRRILTDTVQFRLAGQRENARCLWRATVDFFWSRRGPNPHRFADSSGSEDLPPGSGAGGPSLPLRRGGILVIAYSNAALIRRSAADLRQRFPSHRVDVLIPSEVNSMDVFEIEGLHRRPTRSFLQRLSLARWALKRYDAVARHDTAARFAFEQLFPMSILVTSGGELTLRTNRRLDFLLTALARPFVLVIAAGLALLAVLKPRPRVDYFPWKRRPTGE